MPLHNNKREDDVLFGGTQPVHNDVMCAQVQRSGTTTGEISLLANHPNQRR